ncbi:MAG: hypothetical protein SF028_05980 [Candidatus Sumerlaeia bacterium]|nr:hypothetical protein [Candidatus Sumerlaeia bacterium]
MQSNVRPGNFLTRAAELSVPVGIIALLALLAGARYDEATTRAKYAQVINELRTQHRAVVAYAADHSEYPVMTWAGYFGNADRLTPDGVPAVGTLPKGITTPIAYLNGIPEDPFLSGFQNTARALYSYRNIDTHVFLFNVGAIVPIPGQPGFLYRPLNPSQQRASKRQIGTYAILSVGPNFDEQYLPQAFSTNIGTNALYDPTNGTASSGPIMIGERSRGTVSGAF